MNTEMLTGRISHGKTGISLMPENSLRWSYLPEVRGRTFSYELLDHCTVHCIKTFYTQGKIKHW